jgi:transcriptional antiterminator RfaH
MNDAGWLVVRTQPCAEEKAQSHLVNQGFVPYLPRYRRRVVHARRARMVLRPLFPAYLFVRFDPARTRWRSINGTVGVRYVLTDGERPRCVPERVVQEIVAREDETGAVTLNGPSLVRGQEVRLVDGPMADVCGIFEQVHDSERVLLLLTLLGRSVRVVVPASAVAAA